MYTRVPYTDLLLNERLKDFVGINDPFYKHTDPQFNLYGSSVRYSVDLVLDDVSVRTRPPRASQIPRLLAVISPDLRRERPLPPEAKKLLLLPRIKEAHRERLGLIAGHDDDISVFAVPPGARRLSKTLVNSPYVPSYTDALREQAESLITELNEQGVGVALSDIGTMNDGTESPVSDDVTFLLIPVSTLGRA